MKKIVAVLALAAVMLFSAAALIGCGGGSEDGPGGTDAPKWALTVEVKNAEGEALSGAQITSEKFSGATDSKGQASFAGLEVRDTQFTVSKEGYLPQTKRITENEIAAAENNVSAEVVLAAEEVSPPDGYQVRSENHLAFSVKNSRGTASYYWYAEYGEDGISLTVDVLDADIRTGSSDIGMNDNVEFVMQINNPTVGWDAGNSLDILIDPASAEGWARRAVSDSAFGTDEYARMRAEGSLAVGSEQRTAESDGWDGYTVTVAAKYSLFGTAEECLNNLTIMPSARNSHSDADTVWRSYVGHNCWWEHCIYAVRILEDGSFSANYFDLPDFEEAAARICGQEGKTLADDMAEVSTSSAIREFTPGANLFTDREYLAEGLAVPEALFGKSYIYDSIDGGWSFTVETAGFVIVASPTEGFEAAKEVFLENGFQKMAEGLPRLGYSPYDADGITGTTDYFIKWCEAGESYAVSRWAFVFFAGQAEYEQDEWVAECADILVINTPELIERYANHTRQWQGTPSIAATALEGGGTRLWMTWHTGSDKEPRVGNYAPYYFSDDGGKNWVKAFVIAFPGSTVSRISGYSLFNDEEGNLWLWWSQSNLAFDKYGGDWCVKISNPEMAVDSLEDLSSFEFGQPQRCGDGLKYNKPIVLENGEWMYASFNYARPDYVPFYFSSDHGETWTLRGETYVPNALFGETAIAEGKDASGKDALIAITRCCYSYNLAVSYSYDGGYTWTDGAEWMLQGPSSRPNLLRLASGNLLYLHHFDTEGREKLCAYLSEDGGANWSHALILDARTGVSYPDATQDDKGNIYVVWDYNRYSDKSILMAKITEEELLAVDGVETMDPSRILSVSTLNPESEGLSGTISGYAVGEDAQPVAGATVTLADGSRSAVADENGYWVMEGLPVREYTVHIEADGYAGYIRELTLTDFVDSENYSVKLGNCVLIPKVSGSLAGSLRDIFGNPVEGAEISVEGTQYRTATDGEGKFAFVLEADNYTLVVEKEGFERKTISVSASDFVGDEYECVLSAQVLMPENTAYLGEIGGTKAALFDVYLKREETGLRVYALNKGGEDLAPASELQLFVNVFAFTKARTQYTWQFHFLADGTMSVNNFPNNKNTEQDPTGMANQSTADAIIGFMPYAILQQGCPDYYTVYMQTPLGLSMLSAVGSKFDVWEREDLLGVSKSAEVVRGNTKDYIIFDGNARLSSEYEDPRLNKDWFESMFEASEGYVEGKPLFENMAGFDVSTLAPSLNAEVRTVAEGVMWFKNRDTHFWDTYRIRAFDGMSFICKDRDTKQENLTIEATSEGYLLMARDPKETAVDEAVWKTVVEGVNNPGYDSSGMFTYSVAYVTAGQTITFPEDAVLLTNAL